MRVTRLLDAPIITPDLHPSIGHNIQGPSLIRVPDWVSEPHGHVNQLRDPAIFEENDHTYLLYAVAGESGIAIAEVEL